MIDYQFVNELEKVEFKKTYSVEDSIVIMKGFYAPTMDHKWDFFYQNNELNIHRSWTGIGLFKVKFQNIEGSLHITDTYVDKKFINDFSKEFCIDLLNWCIEFNLFNRFAEAPKWNF